MQSGARRRAVTRNGVVAGSVWETRMRMDEAKGGIKVFNGGGETREDGDDEDGDHNRDEEDGIRVYQSSDGDPTERRKRRSWKPLERSPIQQRKPRPQSYNRYSGDCRSELCGDKGLLFVSEDYGRVELKTFDDKEIDTPVEKPKKVEEQKRARQIHEIPVSSDTEEQQQHVIDPNFIEPPLVEVVEKMPECASGAIRVQSLVDLVMWKDTSKSAFILGCGTFLILSSSYIKDLNFSFISAICYVGLVYLAVVFLYKSNIPRGGAAEFDERYMVREEEAVLALRLLIPYINEMLLKIRALFSGDPATTMKLAVLLFVMARCGSSITVWALPKLVFFGVFTVPKLWSSYSVHLTRYVNFWWERLIDEWESCSHKKAIAAAAFTLIWTLSSTSARFLAVFMLVVGVRFYQLRGIGGGQEAAEKGQEDSKGELQGVGHHRQRGGPTVRR